MECAVSLLSDLHQLQALKDCWRALSASMPENTGAFSSWEFVHTLVQCCQPKNWFVLVVRDQAEPHQVLGIFPLQWFTVEASGLRLRMVRSLGVSYAPYIEYPVLACYRVPVWQAVLTALPRMGCDAAFLGPFHQDSGFCRHLLSSEPSESLKCLSQPALRYLDAGSIDAASYFAQHKSSFTNLRRLSRRLDELGKVEYALKPVRDHLRADIDELCRLQVEHFGEQHLYGATERWQSLVSELVERHADQGPVEFATLRLDGRMIAAWMGLRCHRRTSWFMTGYDPAFRRYSPGKLLTLHLIERDFKQAGVFCFGGGDFPYKRQWSDSIALIQVPWLFFDAQARAILEPVMTKSALGAFANRDVVQLAPSKPALVEARHGVELEAQGRFTEAMQAYGKSVSMDEAQFPAQAGYAQMALFLGDLPTSVRHYRRALALLMQRPLSESTTSERSVTVKTFHDATLWQLLSELATAGVHAFATSGTLLSLVREQRLVPAGQELTIGLPQGEMEVARTCLRALGWRELANPVRLLNPVGFQNDQTGLTLKLHGFVLDQGSNKLLGGYWQSGQPWSLQHVTEYSAPLSIRRVNRPCGWFWELNDSIAWLETIYGDWRTTALDEDVVIAARNQQNFSLLTEAYALVRLINQVRGGKLHEALATVLHCMRLRAQDELFMDVQSRLVAFLKGRAPKVDLGL